VDSGTTLTVRLPQKINSKSQSTSQAA
jgi:hypothetical protein